VESRAAHWRNERVSSRSYGGDEDSVRIRDFLIETYGLTRTGLNWEMGRWEWWCGSREAAYERTGDRAWMSDVRLWETADGDLVGVAHPENPGNAFLQIHPGFRHLEDEMVAWAEERLAVPAHRGGRRVYIDVYDYDIQRQELLTRRGFVRQEDHGYQRWRDADALVPVAALADGYTVRSIRPGDDHDRSNWVRAGGMVFQHYEETLDEYRATRAKMPSFRPDLQLIAEAGDDSVAAFCGVTLDTANKIAIFEPVGTLPDHRRKGLARALMCEGLRRVTALGAVRAVVGTHSGPGANRLYASVGFTECYSARYWRKVFPPR